jgi:RimJ/RimL family protein N-acetyltransferase
MMNPLLLEVPAQLTTARLLLRSPRAGDGAVVWPSVRDSLVELKRWMPWAKDDYAPHDAEQWCRASAAQFITRQQLQFLMFRSDSLQHIGNIGLFRFNWDVPSCEIGYWLHAAHRKRGYMSEAVHALTALAFETLDAVRVQLTTDDRNEGSWRVAERCGYELEGVMRNDCRTSQGTLGNTRMYSRIPAGPFQPA